MLRYSLFLSRVWQYKTPSCNQRFPLKIDLGLHLMVNFRIRHAIKSIYTIFHLSFICGIVRKHGDVFALSVCMKDVVMIPLLPPWLFFFKYFDLIKFNCMTNYSLQHKGPIIDIYSKIFMCCVKA